MRIELEPLICLPRKKILHQYLPNIFSELYPRTVLISSLPPTKLPENIDEQVNLYNTILQGLLDSHAPKRTCFVTLRPHAPWFDDSLRTAKQEKRRCEQQWRKSGLEVHRQIYQQQCAVYWNLLENAKTAYHRATVERAVTTVTCSVLSINLLMERNQPSYHPWMITLYLMLS